MPKSALIPITIGILVSIIGATIIYIKLRKRKSSNASATGNALKEFAVPNSSVTWIIGKNNETLDEIQQLTGAKIHFREEDDQNQICQIGGDMTAVEKAEAMIQEIIAKQSSPVLNESIPFPSYARGKIIGLCGETLEDICSKSEASVWIEDTKNGDTVKITGTKAQINAAKVLVEQKVIYCSMLSVQFYLFLLFSSFLKILINLQIQEAEADRLPKANKALGPPRITQTPEPREVAPPKKETLNFKKSDDEMEVYVTAVVDPSKFFIQIIGPQTAELDLLIASMTEYYSSNENRKKHAITQPVMGQLVAARFDGDDR